jgi:hypothetical protein
LGAVGLGLFLLLLLSVAVRGFRLRGQKRRLVNVLLVTLLIGLLPGHWEYHKATWLIVALMLAETASTQAAGRVALASKQQSHPLPDKLFVAAANPASTYGKDPNSS